MKKRDKKIVLWGCLIVCVLLSGIVIAVLLYNYRAKPYRELRERIGELLGQTYEFSVEYTCSGKDSAGKEREFAGDITGSKGARVIFGEVQVEGRQIVKLYIDREQDDIVFDMTAFFDEVIDNLESRKGYSLTLVKKLMGDVVVSKNQIREIIGEDFTTVSKTGLSREFLQDILEEKKESYRLNYVNSKEVFEQALGEDALYYYIICDDPDTKILFGISSPREDRRISVHIFYGDMEWKIIENYTLCDVKDEKVPECRISDKTIKVLKEAYRKWNE